MSLVINVGGLQLDHLISRVDEAMPDALDQAIEHIRGVAVERTPVETGRLAGSATPHVDPENGEASITYDGPYALYQHESLVRHGTRGNYTYGPQMLRHEHGQAKFLESALLDEGDTALAIVARKLREAL